jgi:elongator complex protein 1
LLIAQQSQKVRDIYIYLHWFRAGHLLTCSQDPREYLPYLQSLQELPPLRRSFAIDDKLGRRRKALGHLYDLKSFEEFDTYTQIHELYSDALQFVKYQPELLSNTMRLFAEFLTSHDRFKEAGVGMFETLKL